MALRILVADDAGFIRDMVKKNLRERIPGVEIFEAADGSRALAAAKGQTMDLILSDWEMPNLSGEELLRSLRNDERYQATPFIMISSRGDRAHVVKAVEAGVNDYISKPFTPDELIRKVFKQLKKIGKLPKLPGKGGQVQGNQGHAFGSVDVLTGGGASETPEKASPRKKFKAQIRFDNNKPAVACVIRDLNLQTLSAALARDNGLPNLFDQVVVDIGQEGVAEHVQLNAYVHSLQAAESIPTSRVVKAVLRFIDNDAAKSEQLSRLIG
ncbi:response regulator [Gilvimarinus agarilyticus]|uniref:response regulator n=1 Tax=unclassified Gilvimarinus TaxID=2642066 RepID=UPI001C083A06|nr:MULTISPECIES: response regulator [unclassified Gilvimarinus]MBU2886310.1 response regulator [Gilvimarinus agarilyticus]MDO6570996.1 response regulator [Gilvimarinus sp. 2_MG-2023]MDO6747851.1 response regulator [Gilvimarinus sp. 1_MG-2023]